MVLDPARRSRASPRRRPTPRFARACWRPTRRSRGRGSRCAAYKTTTAATCRTARSQLVWTCMAWAFRVARPRPSTRCTWARPRPYVEGPWPSRPSRGASPTAASCAQGSGHPLGRSAAHPCSRRRRPADVERGTRRRRKKPFPRSFRRRTRVGESAPPRGPRSRPRCAGQHTQPRRPSRPAPGETFRPAPVRAP